jgi:hypothetical protein
MRAKSSGPAWEPARQEKVTAKRTLNGDSLTDDRQNEADALFGVSRGTYEIRFEPSAPYEPQPGIVQAWKSIDAGSKRRVLEAIRELAATGRPFTSDLVRERVSDVVMSPQSWGSCLSQVARTGAIRRIGFVPSTRPERAGGFLSEWVGV